MSSALLQHQPAQRRRNQAPQRAQQRRWPRMSRLLAWLLAAFVGNASLAQVAPGALPAGGKVVVGSGQLQFSPNLLVVQQNTSRLGLDWQSFNIGGNAVVEFRQPSADSVALNRVLGNSGSEIYGRLRANGQVFLSNPNGVLFAPGAKVDVGGLIATTLDLLQQDFSDGRYLFGNPGAGAVVNQGSLQAANGGYLALLGNHVDNSGEMAVNAGSVVLASGRAVTVSISGHGLISAVVAPGTVAGSVVNSGSIASDGGTVMLSAHSAQQIAASLVNNSGIVRAHTLIERAGEIWITGDNVATSGSVIANAPEGGNAGRIMVIGDLRHGQADIAGTLQASASGPGAAGGFIETSAARVKVADGTRVNTLATFGPAGTWLIDPVDYTVAASGGDITGATLSANLAGGNISILSTQGSAGTVGDVNVNDTVSWSANRLTLNAQNNINVNSALNGSGTASLAFEVGQAAVAAGNTSSARINAPVSLPAGQTFTSKLGSNGSVVAYNVITTLAALEAIDGNATALAGHYALGADIDASSTAGANGGLGFNPIGNESANSNGFIGSFDGLGHTVTGLTIARPAANYVGLFASTLNATLRNFRLVGGSVSGLSRVGAVVGFADGTTNISNVASSTPVSASNAAGVVSVGGLVGEFDGNASGSHGISASTASGSVNGQANIGGSHAGGLVGLQDNGHLIDATASGTVTLTYTGNGQVSGYAGGLVGRFNSAAGIVRGNATGSVSGNYDAGGLAGYYSSAGNITNSRADGAVSGTESVGGLVGYIGGGGVLDSQAHGAVTATSGAAGGLVGYITSSSGLTRVQATGAVSSPTDDAGGLVGYHGSGNIIDATASGKVSAQSYGGGLVGQMGAGALTTVTASGNTSAGTHAGGLVGYHTSTGAITGGIASGNVSAANSAGGLVGYLYGAHVIDSRASGDVSAVSNSTVYVGGLIGQHNSRAGVGNITGSRADGRVFADANSAYAGGLVGIVYAGSVVNSQAHGSVTARDSDNAASSSMFTGGLVGYLGYYNNQSSITGSTASGAVIGNYYTGGLVGYFQGTGISTSGASGTVAGTRYVGGLVGQFQGATLSDSTATGAVSGSGSGSSVGGLAGYINASGTLNNVSASGNVSHSGNSTNAIGGLVGELYFNGGGLVNGFASGSVSTTSTNSGYAGGLIGYLQNSSSIAGSGVNDSAAIGDVSGGLYSGGLIGRVYNYYGFGKIANSRANGNVTGGRYSGGLIGYYERTLAGSGEDIVNSHATGQVSGLDYVGGLVGQFYGRNGIVGSYASGSVLGRGATSTTYLGGLVGSFYGYHTSAQQTALISQSYATGNVSLADNAALNTNTTVHAGGLAGMIDGSSNGFKAVQNAYASGNVTLNNVRGRLNAGGLVGQSAGQVIEFAYARGAVSATGGNSRTSGGLLASRTNTSATVSSSYWDTAATGQAASLGGGSGLSGAQMLQSASFSGFDINTTGTGGTKWRSYDGFTAPLLTYFLTPLTLALADASKTYDGSLSFGNASLGPNIFADRILGNVSSPDAGIYSLSAANIYSRQNGYDLTVTGSANLTVTQKQLTLAGVVADKVYDGTRNATLAVSAQPTGLVVGENLVLDTSGMNAAFDTKTAGIDKAVTINGLVLADGTRGKASNYTLAGATQTSADITAAPLTVGGFAATHRVYDGSTAVAVTATAGTVSGRFGNDDVTASIAAVTGGTVASKTVGSAKPVTVQGATLTGADAGNYVIAGINAVTVDITPRPLTVNGLTASNRVYNSSTNVNVSGSNATLSGAVAGDALQLDANGYTGSMADKHVAYSGGNVTSKTVTVSGTELGLRGADAGNYAPQAATTTVIISPYQTYLVAQRTQATDRVYDGTDAATVQLYIASFYGNDDLTFSNDAPRYASKAVAYNGNNVTSKAINVANVALSGADAGNYLLISTSASTTGTISPKPLAVTGVTAVDRAYNGTVNVTVNVAGAAVDSSGVIVGDQVSATLPGSGTVVGTMANKTIGNNKAVNVPGFSLSGTDAGNYTVGGSGTGVAVNITAKVVNPTYSGIDRTYDGTVRAVVSATSADIEAGDDVHFHAAFYTQNYFYDVGYARFTGTGAKNVGAAKPISIVYDSLYGTDASNYTVNFTGATTTAGITPKGINAAFTGVDKVYDRTADAAVTLTRGNSGIVGNDVVTSTQTAVFSGGKNVGDNKAIAVSGIVLAGADAFNYSLNGSTANTLADITAKTVTVSGITATNRAYDGTLNVALTASTLGSQGFISGDDVQVQPPAGGVSNGTVATKGVETAKAVEVTGLTLAGADAANYRIDSAASGINVDITPRSLTASYVGVNRAYNGGITANVNGSSADIVVGDAVSFTQSAIFTGLGAASAGSNKPISITNIGLAGTDATNYALQNTSAAATAAITQKGLTVGFTGVNRVYNGLTDISASVLGSSTGIVAGDLVSFSQTATFQGDGAVGNNKTVNISNLALNGAQAANYSLLGTTGTTTANITRRPIGIIGITASNRTYDGTRNVNVNSAGAVVDASSVIAGDQVSAVLPPGGISDGLLETKDAGTNRRVTITGITLTGLAAANYEAVGASGLTVNIAPRQLNASYTAANKVYDGSSTAVVSGSFADVLSGDATALGVSAGGVFSAGKNAGSNKDVVVSGAFLTGVERNNYALQNTAGSTTATITRKDLAPSYSGGSKVYDGGTVAPVNALSGGIISGDNLSFSQTAQFTGSAAKDVGSSKPVAVSGITIAGADADNYQLTASTASTTAQVTPKPISIDGLIGASASNRVYDGTRSVAVTVTSSGTISPSSGDIVAGDVVTISLPTGGVASGTMANKNAGTGKAVVVDGLTLSGTDAGNYSVAATTGVTVNIARKPLTASYTGNDKVYDGSVGASAGGTSADIVSGDVITVSASGVYTGSGGRNAGNDKPIDLNNGRLAGADAANYTLLNGSGSTTGDITPRPVTAAYQGNHKVYDGTTAASVRSSVSFVAGDAVGLQQTAVYSGVGARNVGNDKAVSVSAISLTGADAANYSLTSASARTTANITPKPLRIVGLTGVSAVDRVYDGSIVVAVNVTATGPIGADPADVVRGDDVSVTAPPTGATTGTMLNKSAGANKPVAVAGLTLSGTDAANYSITATSGVTVNIARRDLAATFAGVTRDYDGTVNVVLTGITSGSVAGDELSVGGSGVYTGSGARNAGVRKTINVTGGLLAGTDAGNYSLLNPTGSALGDVLQKSVSASYTGGTRIYDGSVVAPVTGNAAGFIAGDDVALTQAALFTGTDAKNVGSAKAVSVTGIGLQGADAANYLLTGSAAATTASVTPRPLRVEGFTGVSAANRVYDGSTVVAVVVSTSGPVTPNAADLIAGDVVTVTAPTAGATAGTMQDKHVGNNKPVAVTGLTLGGADARNYTVATTSGVSVNIAPKSLTASYAGVDREYDGSSAASFAGSSADIVTGDAVTIGGNATFTGGKNAGVGKAVAITGVTLASADATNYTLLNTSGSTTASITPRNISASYNGGTRVYDGTLAAPVTSTTSGLVSGDNVSLTQVAEFDGAGARNVGDGKTVIVRGIVLGGVDAANYALAASTATTTASITPRPLNVTGVSGLTAVDREYDTTTEVQINGTGSLSVGINNVIAGDDVAVALPSGGINAGSMTDKHAGSNKGVVLSGLQLSGNDAFNYAITGTVGLTVNITPRPLAVAGISAIDRVYDGSLVVGINTAGGSLGGALAGDDIALGTSGVTATMADKHAGSAKAVNVAGLTFSGADARNYVASSTAALTVSIVARSLQTGASAADKIYDGSTSAALSFSDNRVAGDTLNLAGSGSFADKDAATAKPVVVSGITLGGADAGNYTLASTIASSTATISRAPATVVASTRDKVYGDNITFSGTEFSATLVGSETIGQVTLQSAGAAAAATVSGGPYNISVQDARGGSFNINNYTLSYQTGRLLVTPRPLTVATDSFIRYADVLNPLTWSFSTSAGGLVGGDSIVSVVQAPPTGSDGAPGGSIFALLPSGAVFGSGDPRNYALQYAGGLLVVLSTPPRVTDTPTGSGNDNDGRPRELGVVTDGAEIARNLAELGRAAQLAAQINNTSTAASSLLTELALQASEDDIGVLLAAEASRLTPSLLQRLPLITLDPLLKKRLSGASTAP